MSKPAEKAVANVENAAPAFETYDTSKLPKPGKTAYAPDANYLAAVKQTDADHPLSVKVKAPETVKDVKAKLNRVAAHLNVTVATRLVENDTRIVFWQRPKIVKTRKPKPAATLTAVPTATDGK